MPFKKNVVEVRNRRRFLGKPSLKSLIQRRFCKTSLKAKCFGFVSRPFLESHFVSLAHTLSEFLCIVFHSCLCRSCPTPPLNLFFVEARVWPGCGSFSLISLRPCPLPLPSPSQFLELVLTISVKQGSKVSPNYYFMVFLGLGRKRLGIRQETTQEIWFWFFYTFGILETQTVSLHSFSAI